MMRIYTRNDIDTGTLKLVKEFEEHFRQRNQAEPGIDYRDVFEDWARQKVSCLQLGIFKLYTQPDE